jgi:hypothetical protein
LKINAYKRKEKKKKEKKRRDLKRKRGIKEVNLKWY